MTTTQQLALALVREITAEKRQRRVAPDYAISTEIIQRLNLALDSLVADGTLIRHLASVNRHYAYEEKLKS